VLCGLAGSRSAAIEVSTSGRSILHLSLTTTDNPSHAFSKLLNYHVQVMPRQPPSKIPFRIKGSRSSGASRTTRTGSSRSSTTSRYSAARSASVVSRAPSNNYHHRQRAPVEHGTSDTTLFNAAERDLAEEYESVRDDTLSEIIMAVDMTPRSTVGCCYYIARDEMLYFMDDIQIGDVDIVDTCRSNNVQYWKIYVYHSSVKSFIEPTVILVSNKVDDSIIERFDPGAKNADSVSSNNDQFRLPFLLDVRPPSDFYYDAAKSKLMTLRLSEEDGPQVSFNVPGDYLGGFEGDAAHGQQGQLLRLTGWFDMENRVTVSMMQVKIRATTNLEYRLGVLEHFFHTCSEGAQQRTYQATRLHICCFV